MNDLKKEAVPILEYDGDSKPIIFPKKIDLGKDSTPYGVLCFSNLVFEKYLEKDLLAPVYELTSIVVGKWKFFRYMQGDVPVIVANPGLGAAFAALSLEVLISMGCSKIIACGMAGVLDKTLPVGFLVVPKSAVRDEGVSYHYLPPSREVTMPPSIYTTLKAELEARKFKLREGKTWTTDAFFRETKAKIIARRKEGCLTVEMEAAALMAVAQHRNIDLGYILACGDDVSGDDWDTRDGIARPDIHETLFQLAAELVQKI